MVGDAGITYKEYLSLYEERVELYNNRETSYTAPGDSSANTSVDWAALALWALAFSLDKAQGYGMDLLTYSIGSPNDTNIIQDCLYNTRFHGVSGYISFDSRTGFTESQMFFRCLMEMRLKSGMFKIRYLWLKLHQYWYAMSVRILALS